MLNRLRNWARALQREVIALWFCSKHPDTPLAAKLLALAVVAYALSPIDLIPDFIPLLGYLDDLLLLPLGLWLALKLIPPEVLGACRAQAAAWTATHSARPRNWWAAAFILGLWALLGVAAWQLII